ncbi:molecular chaperone Tir [Pseudomonas atacamensis]|uniref:molecular chaperone Tir n=1 Tax=Pseudomonas atacamensis TaxID=2565368 RepID=UPI002B45B9A9|nr:molecular chaperone Tir [Pseudomonas atacamensis]MEB2856293.1 molecular chaperone Tir [Pseudomonas atacamensis]
MPVFISYRHMDRAHAIAINTRLTQAKIRTYLDVLDPESQKTAQSWWVPFEIGEATISNRRICTFKTGPAQLPIYLDKWPKLSTASDLDFFIDAYRDEVSNQRSITLDSFSDSVKGAYKRDAEMFHEQLKNRIRRGF